jgi:hypothetical protein
MLCPSLIGEEPLARNVDAVPIVNISGGKLKSGLRRTSGKEGILERREDRKVTKKSRHCFFLRVPAIAILAHRRPATFKELCWCCLYSAQEKKSGKTDNGQA